MLQFPGLALVQALQVAHFGNPLFISTSWRSAFTSWMCWWWLPGQIRSVTYSIYSVLIAVVSLAVTWPNIWRPEADMPRRMLIIFPVFIYLALVTGKRRIFMYTVAVSFLLGLALSCLFVNGFFIS